MRMPGDFFCSSFGVKTDGRFFVDNFFNILFESIKQDTKEECMKEMADEATLDLETSVAEVGTLQEMIALGDKDPIIFTQLNAAKAEVRKQKKILKMAKVEPEDENDISKFAFIFRKRIFNLPGLYKKVLTLLK